MTDLLWTLDDMVTAMQARLIGPAPDGVSGISIDTRSLEPGEAYFAILGDVHDGHKFVANAAAAGAALSVVSEAKLDTLEGEFGSLLVVDDVLRGLERLGVASRARTNAKILAVTGSVGKTTTKEALRSALEPSGKVHAAVASFNNHWGVPLTLARMPADTEYGVFEIGMNHPGEITPLVKMVQPDVAMIMNVAAVHLGAFENVDEIALAKSEIFDGLKTDGTALLNADDERIDIMLAEAKRKSIAHIVQFGENIKAEAHIDKLVMHSTCSCLTANILEHPMVVKIGVPGRHIVQNMVAVLAAVELVGADLAKAGLAMADMGAVRGRGQRHLLSFPGERVLLIDESYNANPSSMGAALAMLGQAEPKGRGRRIAVLGDMLELGDQSAQLHADLASPISANHADRVFLAGPEMTHLQEALSGNVECSHAADVDELIMQLKAELRGGDVVMVKASNGLKFARLIDDLLKTWPTGESSA